MFIVIDENPNCSTDERVFATSGDSKPVSHVQIDTPDRSTEWCEVTGVEEGGQFIPAHTVRVEDSSDGTAWLIYGGAWGLRFKKESSSDAWSLTDSSQWGLPFLVLDASGTSIRLKEKLSK